MWEDFQVSCGFNDGDETRRFGPRDEVGSSLYQVDTVASISNKGEVSNYMSLMLFNGTVAKLWPIFKTPSF